MSVHYRFKSALEYDTITFDGLHISVKDLKNAILQQKRIGKSTDFDLKITNAQTQEVYEDENTLIPKNASLLIARVPIVAPKQKHWDGYGGNETPPPKIDDGGPIGKAMDLASLDAPEDDKIKAMMSQSTQDYDPSNYMKIRGANQVGPVPGTYRCYKCHQNGHWIKDCPLGQAGESEIKKSTGIPQSFMIPVEGPKVPGAMMMANGQYAVPALDLQAYNQKSTGVAQPQEPKPEIPEDLLCSVCSDLLTDAVMIPCCGNSFCDECIRGVLLEGEDHECPDCHEKDISPATLIPNRFLRKSVANFKNTTGYEKQPVVSAKKIEAKDETAQPLSMPSIDSTEHSAAKEEKTVISEADSTESAKQETEEKLAQPKEEEKEEGPPGVSPKHSPVHEKEKKPKEHKHKQSKHDSSKRERGYKQDALKPSSEANIVVGGDKSYKQKRSGSRTPSPRRVRRRTPNYSKRSRSPDIRRGQGPDTGPPMGMNYGPPMNEEEYLLAMGEMMPHGMPPVQPMQGLPPNSFPPQVPPIMHPAGAPPNFRMPPPGIQPPPGMQPPAFIQPGPYPVQPVFDPMSAPPRFGSGYSSRSREYGGRRGRDRTPPGLIDDPLAAFNRILREKDEKRARQQRMAARRSWSRSRSRSRSLSRSPSPLRRRSRSPRRRRSRSRSFTMSRSRSRSFSPGLRGSPLLPFRRSPPPQPRRGGVAVGGRFRSPPRSSPSRRRIERERNEFERDFDRVNFREKPRGRRAASRERFFDERERDYDRGGRNRGPPPQPVQQMPQWPDPRDAYYPPPQEPNAPYVNRYPPMHHVPMDRKYDIGPPGVEQPPVPGLESEPPPMEYEPPHKSPVRKEKERDKERRERDKKREVKPARSKTPEKRRDHSRGNTPEQPRKPRVSEEHDKDKKRVKEKHREQSEDDKKKSKDKKKHKEKKDEKKKKRDKKDKHHKSRDKKDKKEEFKQVIPKGSGSDNDSDAVRKKIEQRKKQREEEEQRKLQEERKKEERRLRFLDDEKRRREDEARKEEAKRKAIEEARRLLEEEEKQARLETEAKEKDRLDQLSLYDEVIPEHQKATEVNDNFKISATPPHVETPNKDEFDFELLDKEEGEVTDDRQNELEEHGHILELHSDELKLDDTDILAPVPATSKWEVEEDDLPQYSPSSFKESIDPKSKVSNEVLKRAENVIFARAINSIRSMDTQKVGVERTKIEMNEKTPEHKKEEVEKKPRLSVKDRLGKKIDDPDPKIDLVNDRRSPSPSRRSRKTDRKVIVRTVHEISRDKHKHKDRSPDRRKRRSDKEREEKVKEKKRRAQSQSESDDPKKSRKDKKPKKDKGKKTADDNAKNNAEEQKNVHTIEKRKPIIDESNFEPDYDLELHDDEPLSGLEKDEPKKLKSGKRSDRSDEESSSDSSSSSSDDERRRKKRKARKKKKRRESTSSESESESDSSDSDRDRKRRKVKKAKKKKRKSRHK